MPADKQSALAALDEAFADAVKGRYAAMCAQIDSGDPAVVAHIRKGLKDDQRAYALMASLIGELE